MLNDRLAIAILLLPIGAGAIALGGWPYVVGVAGMLGVAAYEYGRMFGLAGQRPALPVLVAGVPLLVLGRHLTPGVSAGLAVLAIVAALAWHLVMFERGRATAGTDFAITVAGVAYLGWMGGYFIDLRNTTNGLWWAVIVFTSIWLADSGAFLVGRAVGRHRMAPHLSPKKTWEGFAGGFAGGALGSGLLSLLWTVGAGPASSVSWFTGALLGAIVACVGPLGDLGISMLKRQTGVKDSGSALAGHGGFLDRIDSWLVAVPVGFYAVLLIQWLTN